MNQLKPSGIVIHCMSEFLPIGDENVYAKDFLKSIGLSVHGFVEPDGNFIPGRETKFQAAHAGKSVHNGLVGLNKHYLGIEVLVKGAHTYAEFIKAINSAAVYTDSQYFTLVNICAQWCVGFDIPITNVVRHSDVSGDAVRGYGAGKQDPGNAFQWAMFITFLTEKIDTLKQTL